MLISEEYCALNRDKHAISGEYGNGGHRWAHEVYQLAQKSEARTILDYGCGKGSLKDALWRLDPRIEYEFDIREYDPAVEGKTEKPERADLVVCTDVLEHVEPECLQSVLGDLHDLARRAILLVIATRPARKTLADGRNTHLIVESTSWWLAHLITRWRIHALRDNGGEFVCIGSRM